MDKKPIEVKIASEFITLGQFLKYANIIQSGGEAKPYLQTAHVVINDVENNRRGRKIRSGDKVEIESKVYLVS